LKQEPKTLNLIPNEKLHSLTSGFYQIPATFKKRRDSDIEGFNLNLEKIFKTHKIDTKELNNHIDLFTDENDPYKISLYGRSDILATEYDIKNQDQDAYYVPSDFIKGIQLKDIIDYLELKGINKFTIIIVSCKNLDESKVPSNFKYFSLNEYLEYIES
jgi:hypothetical protein